MVAVIAATLIGLTFILIESCKPGPPYEIVSKKLPSRPAGGVLELNSSELEQFPLLGDIIDAFDNPGGHADARFKDGVLHYAVYDEGEIHRTESYLCEKIWHVYHELVLCGGGHYFLAYDKHDGNGLQYYTWEAIAIDYSVPIYCP